MNKIEIIAIILFALSVLHCFSVGFLNKLEHKFKKGSKIRFILKHSSELELVFIYWAIILLFFIFILTGSENLTNYISHLHFAEPIFVFTILLISSTRPILHLTESILHRVSKLIPIQYSISFFLVTMILGTILGSFITEPAAMTVVTQILLKHYFKDSVSKNLKYAILGLCFVSISIGGTLTSFAAPPVLMVAKTWNWDMQFMLTHFGIKSVISIIISTLLIVIKYFKELKQLTSSKDLDHHSIPFWVYTVHCILLFLCIKYSQTSSVQFALASILVVFHHFTKSHQLKLEFKLATFVALFLTGLIILGEYQKVWLTPLITNASNQLLYFGSIGLTSVLDNAAITYLASKVETISDTGKYFIVAGSVIGGGLTVIANAPNPIGYSILNPAFGTEGIMPFKLFKSAIIPTIIATLIFYFL